MLTVRDIMVGSRRVFLEVLKFTSASDILLHLAYISRLFASLSCCDELWYELLDLHPTLPSLPPKQQYRMYAKGYLPVISSTELRKFYAHLDQWEVCNLSAEVEISRQMSVLFTIDKLVFVTGAPQTSTDTFTIHPFSGYVNYLNPLLHHRRSMGTIRCNADIYTFGGISQGYEVWAEVYTHELQVWRELPSCSVPRSAFNPAYHQGKIYLLGGCCTIKAEYFDIAAETYCALPLTLPGMLCTIALCTDTQLIAVQHTGYYVCNLQAIPEQWEMRPFPFNFGKAFKSDCPVMLKGDTYYIHQSYQSRIIALKLQEMTYEEFPTGVAPQHPTGRVPLAFKGKAN